jgi:hypothetical protein
MQLTSRQYNLLERAIAERRRIALYRRGSEYVVLPERLIFRDGRETIETTQPSTGDRMNILVDEIESFEILGG